jgi:hypothetical protein
LIVSVLLVASLASGALAQREVKPPPESIPAPVDLTGQTTDALWIELDPREGGSGNELPQGGNNPGFLGVDDFMRGGPVGGGFRNGIPIGFNFQYMGGPLVGVPVHAYIDFDGDGSIQCPRDCPVVGWNSQFNNAGYTELFVSLNGYVIFDPIYAPGARPVNDWTGLGTTAWNPEELPDPGVPNNFVAPYWTDLTIADNNFMDVTSVAFNCGGGGWINDPANPNPDCPPFVRSSAGCICAFGPGGCPAPRQGFWTPCTFAELQRPRGKLLYKTVGDAPNRKFVVEWSYAKNIWTGHLATFQVQLWERSNGILFLFKEFTTKAWWEGHGPGVHNIVPGLLVGMEDWFGETGVGQLYLPERLLPAGQWQLIRPVLDEPQGFCPGGDCGDRPFQ